MARRPSEARCDGAWSGARKHGDLCWPDSGARSVDDGMHKARRIRLGWLVLALAACSERAAPDDVTPPPAPDDTGVAGSGYPSRVADRPCGAPEAPRVVQVAGRSIRFVADPLGRGLVVLDGALESSRSDSQRPFFLHDQAVDVHASGALLVYRVGDSGELRSALLGDGSTQTLSTDGGPIIGIDDVDAYYFASGEIRRAGLAPPHEQSVTAAIAAPAVLAGHALWGPCAVDRLQLCRFDLEAARLDHVASLSDEQQVLSAAPEGVLFVRDHAVWRLREDGSGPERVVDFARVGASPTALAADDRHVYALFPNAPVDALWALPKDGTAAFPVARGVQAFTLAAEQKVLLTVDGSPPRLRAIELPRDFCHDGPLTVPQRLRPETITLAEDVAIEAVRTDGARVVWKTPDAIYDRAIPDGDVRTLWRADSGSRVTSFAMTGDGVVTTDGVTFTRHPGARPAGDCGVGCRDIAAFPDVLLAVTDDGPLRIRATPSSYERKLFQLGARAGAPLAFSGPEGFVVARSEGVVAYVEGLSFSPDGPQAATGFLPHVDDILLNADGAVCAAIRDVITRVYVLSDSFATLIDAADGPAKQLAMSRDGLVWVEHVGGIDRLRRARTTTFERKVLYEAESLSIAAAPGSRDVVVVESTTQPQHAKLMLLRL